jgi:hypothetical protein
VETEAQEDWRETKQNYSMIKPELNLRPRLLTLSFHCLKKEMQICEDTKQAISLLFDIGGEDLTEINSGSFL